MGASCPQGRKKNPLAAGAGGTRDPSARTETPRPGQHKAAASPLLSGLCLLGQSPREPQHGGDQPQHPPLSHRDPGRRQIPIHPHPQPMHTPRPSTGGCRRSCLASVPPRGVGWDAGTQPLLSRLVPTELAPGRASLLLWSKQALHCPASPRTAPGHLRAGRSGSGMGMWVAVPATGSAWAGGQQELAAKSVLILLALLQAEGHRTPMGQERKKDESRL